MVTVIPISGVIGWDVTGSDVRAALDAANGDAIEIQLSSVGGFVFDGLEIFNLIKNYEGEKTARIMGIAASMGSYIPLAADKVVAEGNAVMMIHNAWGMAAGDAKAMREEAAILDGLSSILAVEYAKKSGKTVAEVQAMMDAETWLYGADMLDAGLVDEVVGTPATDKEAAKAKAVAMLADAKKLVAEYEGGDNLKRVAALVDVMRPRAAQSVNQPGVAGPAVKTAKTQDREDSKMTLDELKASAPDVYAAAKAEGIAAERDRVSGINRHAGTSAAHAKICAEAVAQGKSESDIMPELIAAATKATQENAPIIPTATSTPTGLDADDVQAAKLFGMSVEEYRKGQAFTASLDKKEA